MSARQRVFLDTNVLVYLLTSGRKADLAESILDDNRLDRTISTQVINEFVHIAHAKGQLAWAEVREYVGVLRDACTVATLSGDEQDDALDLAERYRLAWFDSLIVASALATGSEALLSEDFQDGMRIDSLRITNPFGS